MNAPIALFVYARLEHTVRTVEALLCNPMVGDHDLVVFSDAPRTVDKIESVEEVRAYLGTISGFRSVTIHKRLMNYGLARSIIEGVSEMMVVYDKVIVLEDDMVSSPHFLAYMNQALELFADNDRVISIHGYMYPVKEKLPEAFFLRGADCWGWGTWRRAWKLFNPNGQELLDQLKRGRLLWEFDFNGSYAYSKMLQSQILGLNDSWAVRWYATAFLANKLTLYPSRSLIQNIGNDSTGVHCTNNSYLDAELSSTPIDLTYLEVRTSEAGRLAVERYFLRSQNWRFKIGYVLKKIVKRIIS